MGRSESLREEPAPPTGGIRREPPPPPRGLVSHANGAIAATGPLAKARAKGFLTLLGNHRFARLWLAQVISQTIMNAANYGMIVLIAKQSLSFTATGLAIVAFSLPTALFAVPAGAMVDRMDKRRVLWMSNALRAVATLGFVVSLYVNSHALIPVYLLSFSIALVSQFFAPAEGSAIPLLVHEDELVNALSLFNLTFALSQAAGLILLGPLILTALPIMLVAFTVTPPFHAQFTVTPVQSLFLLVAVLYVVCALLILTIPRECLVNRADQRHGPRLVLEGERLRGLWQGIVESWHFIRRDSPLLASVWQFSLGNTILATVAMIAPRFVVEFFERPPELAALVFLPAGAGLILGSIIVPHLVKRFNSAWLIASGIVTLAAAAALLALLRWSALGVFGVGFAHDWLYLVVAFTLTFAVGIGFDLVNVPSQTIMQQRSPDWIRGRVLAFQLMLSNAVTVPVVFCMGLLADAAGLGPALYVLAIGILVTGFSSVAYARRAQRAGATVVRGPIRLAPLEHVQLVEYSFEEERDASTDMTSLDLEMTEASEPE
jgi:MFS family permease